MINFLIVLFLGLAGVAYWRFVTRTHGMGAPFVAMEPEVVETVLRLAKVDKNDVFYDLGSGDGRLVIAAALSGARTVGVEIDPLRAWYSRLWIALLRLSNRAKILCQDIFKTDLSEATIVHLYLMQNTNEKILPKLQKELKPGTRVVSTGFFLPGWTPAAVGSNGPIYGPVHLYVVK